MNEDNKGMVTIPLKEYEKLKADNAEINEKYKGLTEDVENLFRNCDVEVAKIPEKLFEEVVFIKVEGKLINQKLLEYLKHRAKIQGHPRFQLH